jgi:hypothetical protein
MVGLGIRRNSVTLGRTGALLLVASSYVASAARTRVHGAQNENGQLGAGEDTTNLNPSLDITMLSVWSLLRLSLPITR